MYVSEQQQLPIQVGLFRRAVLNAVGGVFAHVTRCADVRRRSSIGTQSDSDETSRTLTGMSTYCSTSIVSV